MEFTNSDHRPIWGSVEISAKKVDRRAREPLFLATRSAWSREEALRVVGIKRTILMRRTGASEELCGKGTETIVSYFCACFFFK